MWAVLGACPGVVGQRQFFFSLPGQDVPVLIGGGGDTGGRNYLAVCGYTRREVPVPVIAGWVLWSLHQYVACLGRCWGRQEQAESEH